MFRARYQNNSTNSGVINFARDDGFAEHKSKANPRKHNNYLSIRISASNIHLDIIRVIQKRKIIAYTYLNNAFESSP